MRFFRWLRPVLLDLHREGENARVEVDWQNAVTLHRCAPFRTRGGRPYRDRQLERYPLTRTQIGFLQVALLKALQTAEYPERVQWIEDYKAVETGVDAALFMTE